jgi:hypothetical protein
MLRITRMQTSILTIEGEFALSNVDEDNRNMDSSVEELF